MIDRDLFASGRTEWISPERLKPNPFQARKSIDEARVIQLAGSIMEDGLIHDVLVRPAGADYEIICGHLRVEAFRMLLEWHKEDQTRRRKYSAVRCRVMEGVTELQMSRWAFTENSQRVELNALEEAIWVAAHAKLRTPTPTASDLGEELNLPTERVQHLLRLAVAPKFIQDAASVGLTFDVRLENQQTPSKVIRTLDLYTAVEFIRLNEDLAKHLPESSATQKTKAAVAKALEEEWGLRKVEKLRTSGALVEQKPSRLQKGSRHRPFRKKGSEVSFSLKRLDELTDQEAAELRKILLDTLKLLDAAHDRVRSEPGAPPMPASQTPPIETSSIPVTGAPRSEAHFLSKSSQLDPKGGHFFPGSSAAVRPEETTVEGTEAIIAPAPAAQATVVPQADLLERAVAQTLESFLPGLISGAPVSKDMASKAVAKWGVKLGNVVGSLLGSPPEHGDPPTAEASAPKKPDKSS